MKKLIALSMMTLAFNTASADRLMNYIEMPLQSNQLIQFSGYGMMFKACETCDVVVLKAANNTKLLENGDPIDLQRATELYVRKDPGHLSVFYFRDSLTYDRVSFGSLPDPQ